MSSVPSNTTIPVRWPANSTKSDRFYVGHSRFGSVQAPGTVEGTDFGFSVANGAEMTHTPAKQMENAGDVAALTIAANETHPIPFEVFHSNSCELTGDEQTSERTWFVCLKG